MYFKSNFLNNSKHFYVFLLWFTIKQINNWFLSKKNLIPSITAKVFHWKKIFNNNKKGEKLPTIIFHIFFSFLSYSKTKRYLHNSITEIKIFFKSYWKICLFMVMANGNQRKIFEGNHFHCFKSILST